MPTTLTSMAPAAIVSSIVEGVSIKQETPISGVEGAWAGSYLLIRALVTIGTSPRDIRYEPSYRKVRADDDGQHAAERGGFHNF